MLRDVPSDCTVVGIPGRIVYRSGVRVNPLEHGSLPDSEAVVIRSLLDRIESLEQQVKSLLPQASVSLTSVPNSHNFHSVSEALNQASNVALAEKTQLITTPSCKLKDKAIQEFFDGTGI